MGIYNEQVNSIKSSKVVKFLTICIILSPFLKQYTSYIPGTNLADILMGLSVIMVIFSKRPKTISRKNNTLIFFVFYGVLITLVSMLVQQYASFEIASRLIRFLYYVFIVLVSSHYFDFKLGLKIYKRVCIIAASYLIVQVIVYSVANIILPFKILPIPWAGGVTFNISDVQIIASNYYYRPSSFFIEPGYAVQFLLPGFAFSLYGWMQSNKPDYKSGIVIFSALILSTSAQGVFMGVIILGFYILKIISKNKNFSQIFRNFTIVIVLAIMASFFVNIDIVQSAINKVSRIGAGNSTTLRLYRGFAVFFQLPLIHQVIGLGHGNLGHYVMANNIITKFDPPVMNPALADYANGISATMLYYGVIGLFLLILLYYSFLKNTSGPFRLIAITQIVLTLVEGALFNISIVFYFTLIYSGYVYGNKYFQKEGVY